MTQHTQTTIRRAILLVLDERGEVCGTEHLSLTINAHKRWTIQNARILASQGEITIAPSRGGRGIKTVYKRNRNQPGIPRRKR